MQVEELRRCCSRLRVDLQQQQEESAAAAAAAVELGAAAAAAKAADISTRGVLKQIDSKLRAEIKQQIQSKIAMQAQRTEAEVNK